MERKRKKIRPQAVRNRLQVVYLGKRLRNMKTKFALTRPSSDKPTSIYLEINHAAKRKKFYTGISTYPELWSKDSQRIEPTSHFKAKYKKIMPDFKSHVLNGNTLLSDIKSDVDNYIQRCSLDRVPMSTLDLHKLLETNYKGESTKDEQTPFLTAYMENIYMPKIKSGQIKFLKNNKRLNFKPATIKVKNQALNAFKKYEKENGKIRFENIDMKFYHKFVSWHENQTTIKQDKKVKLSINYIGRLIKELKVILRHAYDEGLHSNKIADNKEFSTLREDVPAVYLTAKELDSIQALKLEGRTAHYRDMMLVGSYTALRFSDYSRIRPEHIKDGKRLEIITQKTTEPVVIPISAKILHILTDPAYFENGKVHAQKFNYAIKDICKAADIDEPIEVVRIIGGLTKITTVPKHELVKSHTMRRTGATNMYLNSIPSLAIMSFTGHKTESAFLKYIKETRHETARRLEMNPFFSQPLTVVK